MSKNQQIIVQGHNISFMKDTDYISLTDIAKKFWDLKLIDNWLRNKNTVEFLGVWEKLNNPDFNSLEFEGIMMQSGLNRFNLSVKEWNQKVNGIWLRARAGIFGWTYAHKDIALEFASWVSPEFKLYTIKEFERLKEEEAERLATWWDTKRVLAKVNYQIHTDAIQKHLAGKFEWKRWVYGSEADMLNKIIFGKTAKEWQAENPDKKWENQRDYATAEELIVLANLEYHNSHLLNSGIKEQEKRAEILYNEAQRQFANLLNNPTVKKLK